jgi:hypothetical protein
MDYSLFIMVEVLVMSERVEKRPGVTPVAFPLQSSLEQPLFRGFMFFRHLLEGTPWGVFI